MPVPETLGPRVALHLLNRAGYGPRPGRDRGACSTRGLTKWIEEQLEPGADPELDTRLARYPTIAYSTSQVLALYNADNRTIGVILDEFFSAKVVRAVHARNQLAGGARRLLVQPLQRLRQRRLRPLLDLVLRARRDPAARARPLPRPAGRRHAAPGDAVLPRQLPEHGAAHAGRAASVGGINENHGRELLELHTVGVDAGYTQTDVVEASRCLTGHGIDNIGDGGQLPSTAPRNHDNGAQAGVRPLGRRRAAARATSSGCSTTWPRTRPPRASSRSKLAQRFVADDPSEALVARLADVFLRTGGDLREVTKALFGSAEFWAEAFGDAASPGPASSTSSARCARRARRWRTRASCAPRSRTRACRSTPATPHRLQQPRGRLAQPLRPALPDELRASTSPRTRSRASRPTSAA